MSEQAGRYQRSFSGLVGSMLVLLLVVIAFVAFRDLNRNDPALPGQAVEYADDVPYYRTQAKFPLLAPPDLPEGWKATSQRFVGTKPQSWHLGILTDQGRYIGLEQAHLSESAMVAEFVDERATRGEDVQVLGRAWHTWTDEGGDFAVVARQDGVTTLVVGTVSPDELEEFVETLR